MAKTLDFTKAKKNFLTITFVDGEKILVRTPTKNIMDKLIELKSAFEGVEENENNTQALGEIYDITSMIMSNNIARKKIEVDYLSEVLDLEDLMIFFESYMEFVNEINEVKN
ncbi:MAG: hypothetical protein PHC95_15110 [Parabacteroides sp.]|nr:hypothetical protein [Parabacteroides sp.]